MQKLDPKLKILVISTRNRRELVFTLITDENKELRSKCKLVAHVRLH